MTCLVDLQIRDKQSGFRSERREDVRKHVAFAVGSLFGMGSLE